MTELPQLEIIYRMMEAFAEGGGTPKSVSTAMQQGLIYVRDSGCRGRQFFHAG